MYRATTSSRAFGEAGDGAAGDGADCGNEGAASTLALRSCETCWPDWMSGSGTLPVSSVCDTVVRPARRGSCRGAVGGCSRERRIVRAKSAMVEGAMAGCWADLSSSFLVVSSSRNGEVWRSDRDQGTLVGAPKSWRRSGLDIFRRLSAQFPQAQAQEVPPFTPRKTRAGARTLSPCLRTSIVRFPTQLRHILSQRRSAAGLTRYSGTLDQAAWKAAGPRRARSQTHCP